MNIKNFIIIAVFLITQNNISQGYYGGYQFSVGDEVYMFGDNIKLREAPNTDSEIITLLSIGKKVTIQKVTNVIYNYKGVDSYWYQVKSANKTGYVVGGLLSFARHKSTRSTGAYFVYGLEKSKEEQVQIVIRSVMQKKVNSEIKLDVFGNGSFGIVHIGNKGVKGIHDIIVIDNYSGAGGIDGGDSYVFYNGDRLIHIADTAEIAEGGLYYYQSNFYISLRS